ncbi:PulJ/GspJ family protein [Cerasicoccus frondis]|uniref:PulJ/GspJ family protein n=1 Tax=Cerasicoccus frondis TaxID=490090 RepID=UPI0028524E5D|nr:prepilin-type N-terminal cleavage/methylation domain-containing protein [Cerasicoccus frondis]
MRKNRRRKGFTLVELLIALAIFSFFGLMFFKVTIESAITIQMLTEKMFYIHERQLTASASDIDMSYSGTLETAEDKYVAFTTDELTIEYSLEETGDKYQLVRQTFYSDEPASIKSKFVLVDDIKSIDIGYPIFNFYDQDNQQITAPVTGLGASAIKKVKTIQVVLDRTYTRLRDVSSGYDNLVFTQYNPIDTE